MDFDKLHIMHMLYLHCCCGGGGGGGGRGGGGGDAHAPSPLLLADASASHLSSYTAE